MRQLSCHRQEVSEEGDVSAGSGWLTLSTTSGGMLAEHIEGWPGSACIRPKVSSLHL